MSRGQHFFLKRTISHALHELRATYHAKKMLEKGVIGRRYKYRRRPALTLFL